MARYLTLSTIGMRFGQTAVTASSFKEMVTDTISSLKSELDQVLPDKPDLVVLPEFCDSPYKFQCSVEDTLAYYKERGNRVLDFLGGIARENSCNIAYPSFLEMAGGRTNSIRIIDRSGKVSGTYSKNHLTIGEIEEMGLLCGKSAEVIECDFGRVACAICFDLSFDELRLKYAAQKPDLIIFSSMYHGGLMQNYWAYSCRAHFAGAVWGNPGTVISPVGEIIASTTNYFDFATAAMNLDSAVVHLDYNWDRLRAMREKYRTKVKVHDPGYLGSVLISSETEELTIRDMIREFEIEVLDDYMDRVLRIHKNSDYIQK